MAIPLSEFVKFFPLRATGLVWFCGAGSSVSAGVPSAYDLTWDFKCRIYCADQSYPLALFKNFSNPAIQDQIQNYFDGQAICPALNSVEEYSYYFERAFSSSNDRSQYIAQRMQGMQLSFGHRVMGVLVKHGYIRLIFTTNFDKAFENMVSGQFASLDEWHCTDIDDGDTGLKIFQSGRRPLITKLHGDYLSNKLKNTSEELRSQDEKLRHILSTSLLTNGICFMGYSGRDVSIMNILNDALKNTSSYPHGIYWFIRPDSQPLPVVSEFMENARKAGKEAKFVEIETFDTAWGDIIKGFDNLPQDDIDQLNLNFHRFSNQPLPAPGKNYPIIRLNAITLTEYPATARIFNCNVGNTKEMNSVVSDKKGELLVVRKKVGVVGFGADSEFKRVFSSYQLSGVDLYQISEKELMYDDSVMKGLLTMALSNALVLEKPLRSLKRREKYIIIPDPKKLDDPAFNGIKQLLDGAINGKLPNTKLEWIIALEIRFQFVLSAPLLLLSPFVIVSKTSDKNEKSKIAPFVKEFTARWYNQKYDKILNAWLDILFAGEKKIGVCAFPVDIQGINAKFRLTRQTAHSKKA